MGFWAKAMGSGQPAPPPHWSTPQSPPGAPYAAPEPSGYQVPQGLAVNAPGGATGSEAAAVETAKRQGYIKRPPEWVQRQPQDTCPQCGGNSFIRMPNLADRCYDCAYIPSRSDRNSEGQVGNAMTHGLSARGATVASTRQAHGLKNFGIIKVE